MTRAFIGIGSNIDPDQNVKKAISLLNAQVPVLAVSTVYLSEPLERPEQPSYYNCVVEIETTFPPLELKRLLLRSIEAALGRKRGSDSFAARPIDLDLILYDDLVMASEELTLPDPEITRRPFLAVPLAELAPDLILPGSTAPIAASAAALPRDALKPLTDYTELIRKEIINEPKRWKDRTPDPGVPDRDRRRPVS